MIDFIVAALPRSGTAWTANWLTTERSLCLHDPFWHYTLADLETTEAIRQGKERFGIACTGVSLYQTWMEHQKCPKLVVHRNIRAVNDSLRAMGLNPIPLHWGLTLDKIGGMHVEFRELFENPQPIWEYLMPQTPFDKARHEALCLFNVQMEFERVNPDPQVVAAMIKRAGL